jgi:arsenite methyltransferase
MCIGTHSYAKSTGRYSVSQTASCRRECDELVLALDQAQHDASAAVPRDGTALHPHPDPPLDFVAASSAQHALTPAGAGPPQHPAAGVFRESFDFVVCSVFMVIPPIASLRPATYTDGDRRQWTHRCSRASVRPSERWPVLTGRTGSSEEESMTATVESERVKAAVRETYGRIATEQGSAGCCGTAGCCGSGAQSTSEALGYSDKERQSAPEGADLGLGCGNPQAIAELQPGERVLDLGSGAGFDAFLAARHVGEIGSVIGVDMTPEMITKSRANIGKTDLRYVEFRLGEIEHLPVADASVDVIMSNCVINLSTDKAAVFREAFRVLAPGGRLAISDIVALRDIPSDVRNDLQAYAGCVSSAALVPEVEAMLAGAGFADIRVDLTSNSASLVEGWSPGAETLVASALIRAGKPATSVA